MLPVLASTSASKPAAASLPPLPVSKESLTKLIALAMSSPDSPLGLIWVHTFQEGSRDGCRRGTELFKDKDVKQAFRDGADEGQIMGILNERKEWEAAGHGSWCFNTKTDCFSCEVGIPDGHTCTTKLDAMVQVDFVKAQPPSAETAIQASPSHHTSSSQTTPPLLVNAEAQAQLMDLPPAATTAPTLDPPTFDWSDNAASIPIHIGTAVLNCLWKIMKFLGPDHRFGHVEPHHSSLSPKLFLVNASFWSRTPLTAIAINPIEDAYGS
ncbi:uncharacterized protein LACBIDRAFT_328306 [Laccaria bicolor S238N-H82]|uniref:Predicted protein n=1 Tax=Laccaria bicolor (strain S238N-H82 / ATCC MYA-4686) TaxID=486041 RepID=B0DEH2_LACBS|nr:uncharacterized protein LACBIDRAFT_328306 [Laccaria bicolor S238N-H82]EDR06933.1 predicted protein [Laccaria bicolor S238N-H82]|eukprot:XP_001882306.1 predicted protein [Laccaria bicolor S238N-H82]